MKYILSSLLLVTVIFQSCSIEKRHYTSGYHLQWKIGNSELKTKNPGVSSNSTKTLNTITASSQKKKEIILLTNDSIGCDTLIMKNGTEVKAKVLEVTPTEVKYKFCNNINGPLYVAYRYNLSYIKYANGTMDSFVNEHPPVVNGNSSGYRPNNNGGYNQNNNGGTFNGNDNHYPMDNYATSEYVRKTSLGALICGLASIFIPYLGLIAAIFAIILGNKCMKLIRRDPQNLWMYSRRAMAGQIIGWIVLSIYLLIILIAILIALAI